MALNGRTIREQKWRTNVWSRDVSFHQGNSMRASLVGGSELEASREGIEQEAKYVSGSLGES